MVVKEIASGEAAGDLDVDGEQQHDRGDEQLTSGDTHQGRHDATADAGGARVALLLTLTRNSARSSRHRRTDSHVSLPP